MTIGILKNAWAGVIAQWWSVIGICEAQGLIAVCDTHTHTHTLLILLLCLERLF